jgi:hypothetical protein
MLEFYGAAFSGNSLLQCSQTVVAFQTFLLQKGHNFLIESRLHINKNKPVRTRGIRIRIRNGAKLSN